VPRVAFFADSFHEVNGVALTCRSLESFAQRRGNPLLSVHTGPETRCWDQGSVRRVELAVSRSAFWLEADMRFDLRCLRHRPLLTAELERFQPDVVHITGPSHLGILGVWASRRFHIPLVASWHTNIHEYGGRRLRQKLDWLPAGAATAAGRTAERLSLIAATRFYRFARRTLAPNPELTALLERTTGRPSALMKRGVDTVLYHPAKRSRQDGTVRIGYAGRLSPEKGVRWLKAVEDEFARQSLTNYEFWIAGHGQEEEWLRRNLRRLQLPGVLKGESLAGFYANLDLFAFPSETDTYGNVIQEAMASGVPCVVTAGGGPKFLVREGVDGLVGATPQAFAAHCARLVGETETRLAMARRAREAAEAATWDKVFEGVWEVYAACVSPASVTAA
jgi:glycosyltransferase involved in cell wall biosynthesis